MCSILNLTSRLEFKLYEYMICMPLQTVYTLTQPVFYMQIHSIEWLTIDQPTANNKSLIGMNVCSRACIPLWPKSYLFAYVYCRLCGDNFIHHLKDMTVFWKNSSFGGQKSKRFKCILNSWKMEMMRLWKAEKLYSDQIVHIIRMKLLLNLCPLTRP